MATKFPDATTTGVPAGVTLTPYYGDIEITTPGTVISGLDIHGTIFIDAPNVTIENCKITSPNFAVIWIGDGATGAVVKNCEINGVGTGNEGDSGILGEGTFLNNNIYNVENGIAVTGPSTIQGNYIHDLHASGEPHYDGIQIDGGVSHVVISHNTIINNHTSTSAVMIDNYFGPISDIKVDGNLLIGGGYTVYSDASQSKDPIANPITGVSFTNNHIGGGYWGDTAFDDNNPVYTGNVTDGVALAATLNTAANEVGCFWGGTKIATPTGEVKVETLKCGDLVLTVDGRASPVIWLGRQTISRMFTDPLRALPIRIKAGALAHNVPSRDLLLSPDHAVLIDAALVQAGALVNGSSIVRENSVPINLTYYHVELEEHALILAENTPAETFVDNVDRLRFDNWAEHVALYPDGKPLRELPYPRAKSHRQVPVNIRMKLAERADAIRAEFDSAYAA